MVDQRRRRRVTTCCLDGNLCRTVVIFVVQVVSLILTPLILIFINEAINPIVVAISIAFLLLLILSLVCTMICRCLYLKGRTAQARRANSSAAVNVKLIGDRASPVEVGVTSATVAAAAGKSSCSYSHAVDADAAAAAATLTDFRTQHLELTGSPQDESPVHGKLCTSKTCVTIVSHDTAVGCPDSNHRASCSCTTDPWEMQPPVGKLPTVTTSNPDLEAGTWRSGELAETPTTRPTPAYTICYPDGDRSFV